MKKAHHITTLAILLWVCNSYAQTIRIKAVGDVMLGSVTPRKVLPSKARVFADSIGNHLQGADITFANLEGVFITQGVKPQKCSASSRAAKRCYEFGMPDTLAPVLKDMHFSVVSMDNNHNSDYGYQGVAHTKKTLDKLGILYAAKKKPIVFDSKGKKIGFVAFGHSSISYHVSKLSTVQSVITELNKKCDLLIVSFHGGAEGTSAQHVYDKKESYYGEDRGNLIKFAHTAIDAGADLIIGHGPHVLRGVELYKEKLIMYSLGNFLTHGNVSTVGVKGIGAIMDINIDMNTGNFVAGDIIPTKQIGNGIPTYDATKQSIDVIKNLSLADFPNSPLAFSATGQISKK